MGTYWYVSMLAIVDKNVFCYCASDIFISFFDIYFTGVRSLDWVCTGGSHCITYCFLYPNLFEISISFQLLVLVVYSLLFYRCMRIYFLLFCHTSVVVLVVVFF
jgi:hypothetical protein